MSFTQFDQSTFLNLRAIQHVNATPPKQHLVALPGAKAPISADRLEALQSAGHSMGAIVQRVNAAFESQPRVAARIAEHRGWVTGPYDLAVRVEAEVRAQQEAESMRRRAAIESAILRARESEGPVPAS